MSEKFESQQFRNNLAKEIKETPEGRKDILEKQKETPEYWQARTEKIKERQDEEEIDNGLGVLVKKKTLYHGSGISGIKKFNKAEEDTVGSGIYFTSEAKNAISYARIRSIRERTPQRADGLPTIKDSNPIIYEVSVENMKLLDLRRDENVKKVLDGFRQVLIEEFKKPDITYYYKEALKEIEGEINSGKVGASNLKKVAQRTGQMFTDCVKLLGYEGLITIEGGEGDYGNHDTYVIFDTDKVKINQERKIL